MLTDTDLRRFAADGYLVVRDAVPEALLADADAEIDAMIGSEAPTHGACCFGWNSWSFGPHQVPGCDGVLRSRVLDVADDLVAPHRLDLRADEIQVAITVPPSPEEHGAPHIDGHRPEYDPPRTFTMLAGVLLTDQPVAGSGNLWVWPGSHRSNARLARERGSRILRQTSSDVDFLSTLVTLPSPVPITGTRGDIVLAHFLLVHASGGNMTIHDRRTLYYRLAVLGHPQWWEATLSDEWFEYPGLRRAASALDA